MFPRGGPVEERARDGGLSGAYGGEDCLGLPQLGHDGAGHVLYLVFPVREHVPGPLEVMSRVVPLEQGGAGMEEGRDG